MYIIRIPLREARTRAKGDGTQIVMIFMLIMIFLSLYKINHDYLLNYKNLCSIILKNLADIISARIFLRWR